ncbi:alpha/beta fold hydrolase [Neorhizobium galegae]|uniref:alpha/beta fold hydrolase n=1 Tax=Neorhizobium galegae TaxID=399 RepID=UPI000621BB1B|nr:alpha/beta hydrolase [Neorhizobium galegae]CDZ63472.1 Haloacetate dehalogenase H-1 [Neorhizobium galegae bv. orientalis]MCQ1575241.1 alpha/beta hydrolase [Neorhizobium galegae]MCQ1809081.1 alpha/beta hydrolase [Neorhizobium galegae]MCQ1839272.1 alpha/beta hydrolase [Neorhizobium galegae]UIY32502.1 alpha/beta hydrolase [Neorhizobium galegae]
MNSRRDFVEQTVTVSAASLSGTIASAHAGSQPHPQPLWQRLYPGYRNMRIKTSGAEINVVTGGSGPPLLLLHGAPDSLVTWHLIAPQLAKDYTLVLMDLRGYGDSSKPDGGADHAAYSKRAMALDGVEVMAQLGHDRFHVVGHDRGGRVGRRMALDHPDKVRKLAVLDIMPEHYLYSHVTLGFVQGYYHWFSFLRPAPIPEEETLVRYSQAAAKATSEIEREYARHRTNPEMIHAMCEDYRASASIDLAFDAADIAAGKTITCPLLTLWAAKGLYPRLFDDVLGVWKAEGRHVSGRALANATHNLQESDPSETLVELQAFLRD